MLQKGLAMQYVNYPYTIWIFMDVLYHFNSVLYDIKPYGASQVFHIAIWWFMFQQSRCCVELSHSSAWAGVYVYMMLSLSAVIQLQPTLN